MTFIRSVYTVTTPESGNERMGTWTKVRNVESLYQHSNGTYYARLYGGQESFMSLKTACGQLGLPPLTHQRPAALLRHQGHPVGSGRPHRRQMAGPQRWRRPRHAYLRQRCGRAPKVTGEEGEVLGRALTNFTGIDRRMLSQIVERWSELSDELKRAVLAVVG